MLNGLKQESSVEIGDRELIVVSEVLVDPETLIVTTVRDGGVVLKKSHVAVPSAAVADFKVRGSVALIATLYAHHLGYLRRLLTADEAPPARGMVRAGTLATLLIGPEGEVKTRAGEDQVPGPWLRAAYLVAGLAEIVEVALDLGPLRRGLAFGSAVSAILVKSGSTTRVTFANPAMAAEPTLAGQRVQLESLE